MKRTSVLIIEQALLVSITRELSKYDLRSSCSINSVGGDASNRTVPSFTPDTAPRTLESRLLRANPMYDRLCEALMPFRRIGLFCLLSEDNLSNCPGLKKSFQNGVYDVEYCSRDLSNGTDGTRVMGVCLFPVSPSLIPLSML